MLLPPDITLDKGTAYNRIQASWTVRTLQDLDEALHKGYQLYSIRNKLYVVGFPILNLLDIGNPADGFLYYSPEDLLKLWQELHDNFLYYADLVKPRGVRLEKLYDYWFILENNTLPILVNQKKRIMRHLLIKTEVKKMSRYNYGLSYTSLTRTNKNFVFIADKYKSYIKSPYRRYSKVHSMQRMVQGDIWKSIKDIARNKIFIAQSGIKYALGYIHTTNDLNVTIIEAHADVDALHSCRNGNEHSVSISCNNTVLPTHDVVVIDNIATGKTLEKAKERIGSSCKIVGLFPKTFHALLLCDHTVFMGHLFSKKDIADMQLNPSNWFLELCQYLMSHHE